MTAPALSVVRDGVVAPVSDPAPGPVPLHAALSHLPDAMVLAAAAILIGLTARDVLDGPDAAPETVRPAAWLDPGYWLRPSRLAGLAPALATVALSALVWTTAMRTWLWGVVALLAVTTATRPLAHGRRLAARDPTPSEAATLAAAGVDHGSVRVVETADPTALNGYTIGGPLSDAVGVSRAAVEALPPAHVAAVVAHERAHHAERHALVRTAASVCWLAAGAAAITTAFATTTSLASAAILAWLAGERVVAAAVGRYTEYRADAVAARRTSPAAVISLLQALRGDGVGSAWGRLAGAVSPHPGYDRRVERLRAIAGA